MTTALAGCATSQRATEGITAGWGRLVGTTAAEDDKKSMTIYTLDNGLKVAIREDRFAPVVAQQIWVRAGGADEEDIEAGVAHVHEHMLFKGTERRGVGQIATEIESSGGRINAFTSWDHTVYHIVVASRFASEGLDVLADAVRHSSFDAAELEKELAVVMEEWRRGRDSPNRRLFEKMFGSAFTEHPYGRPVIGTEESITGLTRERILAFYSRFYTPDNMTLVVVGDVDTEKIIADVDRLFGDYVARGVERPARPQEPAQQESHFVATSMPIKEAHLALGFHIPDGNHDDTIALDALAHVLGEGESSRVYRRLVAEEQIATAAGAFAYTPPDPGMFLATASLEDVHEEAVVEALLEELAALLDHPVTQPELDTARANLESDFVYRSQTVQGSARELGYFLVVHDDPHYDRTYLDKLAAVTPADLQRVARQYLVPTNLTGVSILPDGKQSAYDTDKLRTAAAVLASKNPTVVASVNTAAKTSAPARQPGSGDPEPRMTTLANGVRIIVQEHNTVPLFSVRATMLGGLLAETPQNNGISGFAADMLTRGTRGHDREELALAIESLAGDVSGFAGRNSMGVAATFLSRDFDAGMDLALEVLLEPTFPEEQVEKTRHELLLAIQHREDQPASQAFELAYGTVYSEHPYGMSTLGEAETIGTMTRDQIAATYAGALDPSALVVSVVGDVNADEVVRVLADRLSALLGSDRGFVMPPAAAALEQPLRARKTTDKHQSHIVVAHQGYSVTDPDRHAASVLETVLSAQGGRLFYELRDQQALAYSVTAFSSVGLAKGLIGGYIATDPDNEEKATAGLLAEFDRIRREDADEDELARARRYLIGNYEISLQSNSAIAENLAFNELYGLGYLAGRGYADKIRAVTAADVRNAAYYRLDPQRSAITIVGPQQ